MGNSYWHNRKKKTITARDIQQSSILISSQFDKYILDKAKYKFSEQNLLSLIWILKQLEKNKTVVQNVVKAYQVYTKRREPNFGRELLAGLNIHSTWLIDRFQSWNCALKCRSHKKKMTNPLVLK